MEILSNWTADNQSINEPMRFGGIAYLSKNLWLYVPYLTLFSVGIIAGILGIKSSNQYDLEKLLDQIFTVF